MTGRSPAPRPRRRRTIGRIAAGMAGLAFAAGVAAALGVAGWRACGRYGEQCGRAGQLFPHYDTDTGRIDFVMHDLNGDGVIDTWVYQGTHGITEIDIDQNEDGTIDRVLVPDKNGILRQADATPHP